MRVSAGYRDSIQFAGHDVGSSGAAADVGRATGGQSAVHSLGTAQTKFNYRFTPRRLADARRFGGDERLEIHEVQQRRFDNLRL
jgi:hypothetical protein